MKHFIKLLQIVFILIVNINANAQNNEVIDKVEKMKNEGWENKFD